VNDTSELGRWFRKLWASVKAGLRKIGLDRFDSLTAQDVVNLAYGAARLELEGNWHGTGALFRKFNHAFMGTGEGAQAFGWGTYLAQRAGIAKAYWAADVERRKRNAGAVRYEGKRVNLDDSNPVSNAARFLDMAEGDVDRAVKNLRHMVETHERLGMNDGPEYAAAADLLEQSPEKFKHTSTATPGALMRVDVGVAEHEWLDLDKPFSEQSQQVQDALRKLLPETKPTMSEVLAKYGELTSKLPDRKQAKRLMDVVQAWDDQFDTDRKPLNKMMEDALDAKDLRGPSPAGCAPNDDEADDAHIPKQLTRNLF